MNTTATHTPPNGRTMNSSVRLPYAVILDGRGHFKSFGSLAAARKALAAEPTTGRIFFDYEPGTGTLIESKVA